jgi:hypothetical protein
MNTMAIYLGAWALCGLSIILIKETSPAPLSENPIKYQPLISERKSRRRILGRTLLAIAVLVAGMGLLAQFRGLMSGLP